ncbi:hypothetical protein EC80569_3582, partial [Escherichia coli 8.0569]
DGTFWYGPTS